MARWLRVTGVAGLAAGAAAAATGAVLAAEKAAVGRTRLRPDPEAAEPFGQLRGRPLTVLADDGVSLHAEISGPDDAPVTIIFSHGYTLNQDAWHYQRRDLAARSRLVFWDQRGHGRSGRPETVSVHQLGADLHAVLLATAPGDTPVVLVGHSMGGMTVMALASQHPEVFGSKVIGTVLISTAASAVEFGWWLPGPLRGLARRAAPPVLHGMARGRRAALVERGRQAGGDLAFLGTRYVGFGDASVSPAVVDFLERIIRATPIDMVAQFYAALLEHDQRPALPVLARVPVAVVTAGRDRIIPPRLAGELVAGLPGCDLVEIPDAGHVVILERPEIINDVITRLTERAVGWQQGQGRSA